MPLSMWYDQAITKNKHIRFEQFVAKASHSPMAGISDRFRCRFPPGERGLKCGILPEQVTVMPVAPLSGEHGLNYAEGNQRQQNA